MKILIIIALIAFSPFAVKAQKVKVASDPGANFSNYKTYAWDQGIATGIPATSQAWPVTKGTLVINISDAKSKHGLWRGTATQTLEHGPTGELARDAKTVAKPINKAVEKMFRKFPPQPKQ